MHVTPSSTPTWTYDWGTIKWFVRPSETPGASSTVGEVVINPGQGHDRHSHPDADEVLYVIDGEGVQTVGDSGPFAVRSGDVVHIPRGVEHSTHSTTWRQMRILAVYTPGGAEAALVEDPTATRYEPGEPPAWRRP